jgi:hypothetical protein
MAEEEGMGMSRRMEADKKESYLFGSEHGTLYVDRCTLASNVPFMHEFDVRRALVWIKPAQYSRV